MSRTVARTQVPRATQSHPTGSEPAITVEQVTTTLLVDAAACCCTARRKRFVTWDPPSCLQVQIAEQEQTFADGGHWSPQH